MDKINKRKGVSLMEALIALCMLSVLSASILGLCNGNRLLFHEQSQYSQKEASYIINQEMVIKGFNLNGKENREESFYLPKQEVKVDDTFFKPIEGLAWIKIESKDTEETYEALHALGTRPTTEGGPIKTEFTQLRPPLLNEKSENYQVLKLPIGKSKNSIKLHVLKFPLENILKSNANNPLGTFYRYNLDDGSTPTEESSIWENPSFSALDLPRKLRARSFHTDSQFGPSDEKEDVIVEFSIPDIHVCYKRENDSDSLSFYIDEIRNNTNRIILSTNFDPEFTDICYTFDGSDPNLNSQIYIEPFHVPEEFWKKQEVVLNVKTVVKNAYFKDLELPVASYHLIPGKVKLPKVLLSIKNNDSLKKNQLIEFIRGTGVGFTHVFRGEELVKTSKEDSNFNF